MFQFCLLILQEVESGDGKCMLMLQDLESALGGLSDGSGPPCVSCAESAANGDSCASRFLLSLCLWKVKDCSMIECTHAPGLVTG